MPWRRFIDERDDFRAGVVGPSAVDAVTVDEDVSRRAADRMSRCCPSPVNRATSAVSNAFAGRSSSNALVRHARGPCLQPGSALTAQRRSRHCCFGCRIGWANAAVHGNPVSPHRLSKHAFTALLRPNPGTVIEIENRQQQKWRSVKRARSREAEPGAASEAALLPAQCVPGLCEAKVVLLDQMSRCLPVPAPVKSWPGVLNDRVLPIGICLTGSA